MTDQKKTSFEEAGAEKDPSLIRQFFEMLKGNKKYWLLPIILMLVVLGIMIVLGSSAAAPFIYTLF